MKDIMKKFLLTALAILGFASQAGSKTTITLDQITAPTTSGVMVNVTGTGWTLAVLDSSMTLDTTTKPPTLRAIAATPQTSWVTPTGTIDGVNAAFTLLSTPNPPGSLTVIRGGLTLSSGIDFNLSGTTITFLAGSIPQPGDIIRAK